MPHIRPSSPHGRPRSAKILLTATATLALVGGGLAQAARVPAEPDPAGRSTPLADMVNPFIGTQDEKIYLEPVIAIAENGLGLMWALPKVLG